MSTCRVKLHANASQSHRYIITYDVILSFSIIYLVHRQILQRLLEYVYYEAVKAAKGLGRWVAMYVEMGGQVGRLVAKQGDE